MTSGESRPSEPEWKDLDLQLGLPALGHLAARWPWGLGVGRAGQRGGVSVSPRRVLPSLPLPRAGVCSSRAASREGIL